MVLMTKPANPLPKDRMTIPFASRFRFMSITLLTVSSQEIFARRLDKFYSTTSPLLSYYTTCATNSEPARNPHQHPHQLSFPVRPPHQLVLKTLSGKTSDEIWPQLDSVLKRTFPNISERAEVKRRHSLTEAMLGDGRQVAGSQMK